MNTYQPILNQLPNLTINNHDDCGKAIRYLVASTDSLEALTASIESGKPLPNEPENPLVTLHNRVVDWKKKQFAQ